MDIKIFEGLILTELDKVVTKIIENNLTLNISAKSRAGAEISDFIEEEFVKNTCNHEYFINSEAAPKGATKNPWDVKTFFQIKSHREEIWIDFKSLKISSEDSNPDIGTPTKVINFIQQGNFYLTYIYTYYQQEKTGLKFVKHDGRYTKLYFLKDISSTFRRNPKNQLQVNMSKPPQYRTREEFIKVFFQKIKESHIRQIEISQKELKEIDNLEKDLINKNKISEATLLKGL